MFKSQVLTVIIREHKYAVYRSSSSSHFIILQMESLPEVNQDENVAKEIDKELRLIKIVRESTRTRHGKPQAPSLGVYYTMDGLYHKGYFGKRLKDLDSSGRIVYPIVCHMNRKANKDLKCKHRFRYVECLMLN